MNDDLAPYRDLPGLRFDRPAPYVLRITIDNPTQRNALTRPMLEAIHAVWGLIDADPATRVTIVTGAGDAFSAGGAFEAMPDGALDPQDRFCRDFADVRAFVYRMIDARKPLVAAINGVAVGAGLAIALLADVSVASRSAKLFDGHLRIGVTPGDHALILWPLLCGLAKAKYHLLTNAPVTGEQAEAMNLVSLAVDHAAVQDRALEIAVSLANTAPTALRMTKYLLNAYLRRNRDIFELSAAFEMVNFGSAENVEAMRAFRAGEIPDFAAGGVQFG